MSSSPRLTANRTDGTLLDSIVALLSAEPDERDRDGLAVLVQHSLRVRGWLDSVDARIATRSDVLAKLGKAEDPTSLLTGGGRRGQRDAEAAAARGKVCGTMPSVGDALAEGKLTAGHVDAIANAARSLDDAGKERLAECEDALVGAAASMSPERFDRECRDLARSLSGDDGVSRQESLRRQRKVRRWVDRHTGLHKTELSLDPLTDAKVWSAIHAAVAQARAGKQDDNLTWDQLQADTVVDLITGARGAGDQHVPEVSVLVDLKTLIDGVHDGAVAETSDGTRFPVATIRRLCCDADILPIVLGGVGEVLDVGRQQRLATRTQRRALRAMHRTCAYPGCTVDFDACRIHHVSYWERGGNTDLVNLLPLCERHHHLVHEGGWFVELFADRRTVWRRPDGTVWNDAASVDRTPRAARSTDDSPTLGDVDQLIIDLSDALDTVLADRAPP